MYNQIFKISWMTNMKNNGFHHQGQPVSLTCNLWSPFMKVEEMVKINKAKKYLPNYFLCLFLIWKKEKLTK